MRRTLATQTTSGLPTAVRPTADPTVMPTIDPSHLSEAEQIFIKRFEDRHLRNVQRRNRERRQGRIIGLSFGALVIGIYVFTIMRVRQETFLDDFTVPEPPPQKRTIDDD
jgi:hypothetical protein